MSRMNRTAVPCPAAPAARNAHDRWRADRLREARGILAGRKLHPGTLLILAARVVIAQSADDIEVANARDLWRRLDPRPLATMAQALAARRRSEGGRSAA